MTLQELTTRLQTLCLDGYGKKEVLVDINGFGVHLAPIEQIRFRLESSVCADGFISVEMGDWENYNHK